MLGIGWIDLETHSFEVKHLNPGESRRLYFHHVERNLAGSLEVNGSDNTPIVVKLRPAGSIQGRILLENGDPAAEVEVSSGSRAATKQPVGVMPPHVINPPTAGGLLRREQHSTDNEGRFTIGGLVPGDHYSLKVTRDSQLLGTAIENVTISAGETKDLGDLTILTPEN